MAYNHLSEVAFQNLRPCCRETIEKHAVHNPMIGCSGCNYFIKNFKDERAFINYLNFCLSQNREVQIGRVGDIFVAIYLPYKPNMPTKLSLLTRADSSDALTT